MCRETKGDNLAGDAERELVIAESDFQGANEQAVAKWVPDASQFSTVVCPSVLFT
jgi:hypothetical protein